MQTSVDFQVLFRALPGLYLVVLPDAPRYTIAVVSDAYARATMSNGEEILERGFFDVFPDSMLGASLARVLSTRVPDVMAVEERANRWWLQSASPVLEPDGAVAYIILAIEDVTERHQRDKLVSLADSPFDHASDSIFIADTDGRFTDVNATASEMLGYSREELIGKRIADIIPPEDVPRLAAAREHLLSSGAVQVAEWTQLKKDGTPIPVDVSTKILPDGRWEAFVRDISERKRIETELRDANAFLDAIIENIPLMLFIKEATSLRFVRFNRAGESLLGWPREKLVGKNDFDFWPRDQAQFFVEKDRETMKAGDVVDILEEPIQTRKGIRILHTKKVPILAPSGAPLYLLGISEDITERKRLEEERQLLTDVSVALSGSLDYERTLVTLTEQAVKRVADWCAIDLMEDHGKLRRLKVASADPADAALCAALEKMPPNRDLPNLPQFIVEEGRPLLVEHVTSELIDAFTQGPEHMKALLATGVTSLIGVPLLLRGKALGVLLFGSLHRVYRQDDLRWAEALADRSAVAIENARLYQASVEASQLRDQVLGVVAHDLRNPLATILLQESILGERRGSQRELGVIHRAATRMNRLIEDLLDVSLVEAGQLRLQKALVSARELVVEGVELESELATSVELRLDVGSDADVWGDRDRLLQVLENLIGNAIKFTRPGGRITVGTASRGHEVVFWVADEGSGIAADALPHVFERFWQATRADRRGAGLGLSIVKGIVEAHGGRVWVESRLGRGTTFYFSIPTADPAPERPAASIH